VNSLPMTAVKPIVLKKGGKQRIGKGFSLGELKEAKLNIKKALKLGILVDTRRKTTHKENVKALIDFLENKKLLQSQRRKRTKPKSEKE